ncbi:MAG: ketopantoate reductase family protein [Qingshengfaniella sp.]
MKLTIFGAGATGGHFAIRLAQAGHDVSLIARGPNLQAIRENGLTLIDGDRRDTVHLPADADPAAFGVQDVVYVGVKATGLHAIAGALRPLIGPQTLVIFPQNGIPWWYPVGLTAPTRIPDLPDFRLADVFLDTIAPGNLIGGSIYSANSLNAPGVIECRSPGRNHFKLGSVVPETDPSPVLAELRAALETGGIGSAPVADIRRVVWHKLMANLGGSIIPLLIRDKASVLRGDPALSTAYRRVIAEGMAIARAHGHDLTGDLDVEAMLAHMAAHKPSILQDYEADRPMEIAQIVLAPVAFARTAGLETPVLDTLAALATRMAVDKGLYSLTTVP